MHTALKSFLVAALGAGLVFGATGCEQCEVDVKDGDSSETRTGFCSVKQFKQSARSASVAYPDGAGVRVESPNGQVRIVRGNSNDVNATFSPFVFRAFNTPQEEVDANFARLSTTVTDVGGEIVVEAKREGQVPSTLGADMTVNLPANFSGRLLIRQRNGSVRIDFSGDASEVRVESNNGSIDATANAPVVFHVQTGNGSIDATATAPGVFHVQTGNGSIDASVVVADSINVSSGNGTVGFAMGDVLADAAGGEIRATGLGDVNLRLPGSAVYSVQATAAEVVDFGTPPGACVSAEAAVNSKTLSCGTDGPNFVVTSDKGAVRASY